MCAEPAKNNFNIFSIEYPDVYMCNIVGFHLGHRILEIKMLHPEKAGFLLAIFNGVTYFSGPTSWQGANFKIAPANEFMEIYKGLLHTDRTYKNEVMEGMMETRHLYTVTPLKGKLQVQIFAGRQAIIENHESESE